MLKRDINNGMVFGVCAGLANHLNLEVGLVRLLMVLSWFLTGSITFWGYIIAAIVLPKND